MIRQFKNKRGISLIEVMVGVAIMGTLASIAIPSYKGYKLSTIKTAYKTDLTSLHKAWLTFGIEGNSFCKRKTKPRQASIAYVGMESLFSSNIHGTHKDSKQKFIGFGKVEPGCLSNVTSTPDSDGHFQYSASQDRNDYQLYFSKPREPLNDLKKAAVVAITINSTNRGQSCELGKYEYVMGGYTTIVKDSHYVGYSMTHLSVMTEKNFGVLWRMRHQKDSDSNKGLCS